MPQGDVSATYSFTIPANLLPVTLVGDVNQADPTPGASVEPSAPGRAESASQTRGDQPLAEPGSSAVASPGEGGTAQ